MTTLLLKTKLYAPPVRAEFVSRRRLIDKLNAGLGRKLTLVSAPAGFGKSALLSEWAKQSSRSTAWLSLDTGDNDARRFWTYFIAALQSAQPDVGASMLAELQSRQPPRLEALLAGLINELALAADPIALVLDDFHLIHDPSVHQGLAFLIDRLPPQIHVVFAGRADPPWPVARRRALGEMTELRANDLRFTAGEAAAFLNDVMDLDLSARDVDALEERTEGWIAGLQMAAISMQARKRTRGVGDLSTFVRAFAASNRFILDYLMEEVLEQQPEAIQRFLLWTSVLERLNAALCDAVTNGQGSAATLRLVERANLFLIPLDDAREWYRYHQLFGQLLRTRLQQAEADQVPVLHRRASDWYEQQGWVVDAVSHALAAGDVDRVARLITGNALAIMGHGELADLAARLATLPEEVRSQPWLAISHAWVLAYAGQLREVEERLHAIEGQTKEEHARGHLAAIHAYLAGLRGDMSAAAAQCRQALTLLPEHDRMARAFATSLLGSVLRWSGDLAIAEEVSLHAIEMREAAGDHRLSADAFCDLAALQCVKGLLRQAAATCRGALQLADRQALETGVRSSVTSFAHARLSSVLREWNDVDNAVQHAREGVEFAERWGWADGLVFGYGYLAAALNACGDADGARQAIRKGRQVATSLSSWLEAQVAAQEARLWLEWGNVTLAWAWAQESGLRPDDAFRYADEDLYFTLARVLIARGEHAKHPTLVLKGLDLLQRLLDMAQGSGATGRVIKVQVARALGLQALGEDVAALESLAEALVLAQPEGYLRTFLDGGVPLRQLIEEAAAGGIAQDYAAQLLLAFDVGVETGSAPVPSPPELAEPLSERELQVLRLLRTDLTSSDIANRLFISTNTARTHIKNVYGKLDVHRRDEAVQRAQELGLL